MKRRLDCPVEGYTRGRNAEAGGVFKSEDDYEMLDQALKAMELHMEGHKLGTAAHILAPPVVQSQNQNRIPKSVSLTVEMCILTQEWEYFIGDWKQHNGYCSLTEQKDLVYNLWWCLSAELKRAATDDGMDIGQ